MTEITYTFWVHCPVCLWIMKLFYSGSCEQSLFLVLFECKRLFPLIHLGSFFPLASANFPHFMHWSVLNEYLRATLFKYSEFSLCVSFSCFSRDLTNCSAVVFSDSLQFSHPIILLGSAWVSPLCSVNWKLSPDYYYWDCWDHCLLLPSVKYLENHCFLSFVPFLVVSCGRLNAVFVAP